MVMTGGAGYGHPKTVLHMALRFYCLFLELGAPVAHLSSWYVVLPFQKRHKACYKHSSCQSELTLEYTSLSLDDFVPQE
jgi:hypothetical protein